MVFGTVLASFTFHAPPPAENLLLVIPFPLTFPRFPKLLSAALTHDYSLTLVIHPVTYSADPQNLCFLFPAEMPSAGGAQRSSLAL